MLARGAFVVVALLALANTLRHADFDQVRRLVGSLGPMAALVLVPWGVAMALQTVGYARILQVLRRATSFPRLFSVMLSTEAVLMSFPAGAALAETINPHLLERRCGVPVPEGLAAVAAKKSLILVTNALYMGIAVVAGAHWLREASQKLIGRPGLLGVVAFAAVVMLVASLAMARALFSGGVASRSHGLLSRIPSARLRRWLEEKKDGFAETDGHFLAFFGARAQSFALPTLAFLACWLVEASESWLILALLGVKIPYAEVLAFEVVVSLLKSLAFMVPAGLGIQDAGYVAFFGAFGIPDAPTLGVAFVLVKRTKELFWIAVGFLLFLVLGDGGLGARAGSPDRAPLLDGGLGAKPGSPDGASIVESELAPVRVRPSLVSNDAPDGPHTPRSTMEASRG
jgi:uncharacterized protein (TIRG00374 family)